MSRIRVRAMYTRYPHWGPHAGFHQACRHLPAARVEIVLQGVNDGDGDWPLPGNPFNDLLRRTVSGQGMPWYKLSDLAAELRLVPGVMLRRVDIVHFLDSEHSGQFLPRLARAVRAGQVRTIGTFHQPPELLPGLVSQRACRALDLALVMSPTQEPFFRSFLPPERVRTFLHGVDTDFFRPAGPRGQAGAFRCLTVGHWLRDWSAIKAVVSRMSSAKGLEFHVVTGGETGLERAANVVTHRNITDERLLELYQSSDVLLLPLTGSTANNSLLEALACGLPVISTNLPSVRAYTDEGPVSLVDDNDPDELIECIGQMRDDEARRLAMGRSARARAEQLAWPRRAADLVDIYEALVSR